MFYGLIVMFIVTIFFLLLASWPLMLRTAIVLTAVIGIYLILRGALMVDSGWIGKYLFTILGSYCLWFIAPFVVVWRGRLSESVAWAGAIGLVAIAVLGMVYVSWQLQSPFGVWSYMVGMGLTCLFGWTLANVTQGSSP